jgi:hypothetical protein
VIATPWKHEVHGRDDRVLPAAGVGGLEGVGCRGVFEPGRSPDERDSPGRVHGEVVESVGVPAAEEARVEEPRAGRIEAGDEAIAAEPCSLDRVERAGCCGKEAESVSLQE